MKRFVYVTAFFIFVPICAQPNSCIDQLETSSAEQPAPIPLIIMHHNNDLYQRPSFVESFQSFLRQFIIILTNDRVQANIKLIEAMIISLIKTAFQLIRTQHIALDESYEEVINKLEAITPSTQKKLTEVIIKAGKSAPCKKGPHGEHCNCPEQLSDTSTKTILALFAQIVQNFFNILQDPHNAEQVTPNLMGMLAGMVGIGREVMRNEKITEESFDIDAYVHRLTPQYKKAVYTLLHDDMLNAS